MWIKRIFLFIGYTLIVVLTLAVAGCFLPALPVLGSLGPILISAFGSWIIILSLAASTFYFLRWRRLRAAVPVFMSMLAAIAAIGTVIVEAQQIAAARAHGVNIDLARTLWLGSVSHASALPVSVQYASDRGRPLKLAIYQPPAGPGKSRAPVLVYVHGGGWGGGTQHDKQPDMRWYADHGYLVISVQYTLSSQGRPTWDVAEPQVGCALNWVTANASRLGGDTGHLALLGESAGGNLVLNVAYRITAGSLRPSCPGQLPRIRAVVAPYPVLDAVRMYNNPDPVAGPFGRQMTVRYTGGTPARYPNRYAEVSSGTHIGDRTPPTLILPGLADHLLPAPIAFDFVARARAAGGDIEMIAYPFGEHSFDQMSGSIGNQFVRQATLKFLRRNGVSADPEPIAH
ncbi:hypothetical protein V474_03320 [Novosphingobium barchaimii LL02]|uniref:BD-FAE-like domain-containing protein n=1 Tax=Novosphingobium barchaimii LL02 TaxID=1114963 RepID=A0A0J7XJ44_9SPHN|nr:hypothetical protein V474_03320 [Novosphingobium barchaimii LL02]